MTAANERVTLNVVHFSTADIEGGSARSAWRLHSGLKARGHVSRMLVRSRYSDDPAVAVVSPGLWRYADRVADAALQRLGLQYLALPSSLRLMRHPWLRDADIIQLFNTHGGFFSQPLLPMLGRDRPVVWRLSDLWPITGHCAYPGDCERWRTGCGNCPDLGAYPPISRDTTAYLWAQKKRCYQGLSKLTVVAPSSWTESAARASPLLEGVEILRIPNGIDVAAQRIGREEARHALGIAASETVVLFSAHVAADNPRKGTHLLEEAMQMIGCDSDLTLLVLGQGAGSWEQRVPVRLRAVDYTDDHAKVRAINAAADLVVVPSTVENLPNTLLEAMAQSVPAVAFDIGGMKDAVVDGVTGVLVPRTQARALADGILALASAPETRQAMGQAARTLIETEFSQQAELQRFLALYERLLERTRDAKAAA